jgi:hypothetical protein
MLHGMRGYLLFGLLKREYSTLGILCLLLVEVKASCLGPGHFNRTVIVQGTKVPWVETADRYRYWCGPTGWVSFWLDGADCPDARLIYASIRIHPCWWAWYLKLLPLWTTSGGWGRYQIISPGERGVHIPLGDTNPAVFGTTLIGV